jgi:hypothetical protein
VQAAAIEQQRVAAPQIGGTRAGDIGLQETEARASLAALRRAVATARPTTSTPVTVHPWRAQ